MKFFIDHTALNRLTDPILEIRQNALKEISSIIQNNILVEGNNNQYAAQELSVVNLENLTKQLIRWFKYRPVTNETEVFDLLIMIFSREDFLRHITKTFSLERLRKELGKIARLLIPEESTQKLQRIEDLLRRFEYGILIDVANETGSFMEMRSLEEHPGGLVDDSVLDRMRKLTLSPTPSTRSKESKCNESDDIEKHEFWISLEGANLETFNMIDNELVNFKNESRLKKILRFLSFSIYDFPAEFMLQPPNILESLIDILPKVPRIESIEILRLIHFTVNGLKERYLEARCQNFQYIPIKKQLNKIIQMFTNFFEEFHDSFSASELNNHQELLNSIYAILFDMIDLVECTEDFCDIFLNELLNMFAKVVRDFRMSYSSESTADLCRLNYIVGIYLMNAFISRISTDQIMQYSENNVWEYESDLALLDWTLQDSHADIYNLIKKNRNAAISDDKDMMLLLNVQATWKPVVDLFQNYETYSDEIIIYRGLKCLDTIRIHKSHELVDLLFKTISNCAEKLSTMNRLRNSAEEIVLRLLSIDVPEIRIKSYALAREYVQKKLTEDQDEKARNVDLCAVIGIPITTEIVTEVLCFGYCSENEEIYKHAKLILFALLRAKVVFPNHWQNILEAIRPVLPLVPCLFKLDQKLGFFSFDIFHQHSGFEPDELNQAFVRFLFCTHPKAREMAKLKLLENLGIEEFTQELIEIIPDNFCILPEGQVSELLMPDRNIKYDKENYETIKTVLSAINYDDAEILQSVLLQLSVQMNSSKICHQSHNDNLWVYFMGNLEMGQPNNATIRKLTINILYKWAITVSSFRIYLSNEARMLQFLIKTLVYYQDDQQIKIQTSSLLFLLSFSDFVVTGEKTISLPKFLNHLEHPFKFEQHWTESPFNKITQLEWLYEALEEKGENDDVKEITLRYLKFSFANVWFNRNPGQINVNVIGHESYYQQLSNNALKFSKKLFLTEEDHKLRKSTQITQITRRACRALESPLTVNQMVRLIQEITCTLILPNPFITSFAEQLEKRMKRFVHQVENPSENRKYMLVKFLELYEKIVPWLTDEQIVGILQKEPLTVAIGKCVAPDENAYTQIFKLICCIINACENRKELLNKIIKAFNSTYKVHFPTALIENLCDHLFGVCMKDKSWNDVSKYPSIKPIFILLRNVLQKLPIELDEKFLNDVFAKLVSTSKDFLKSKRNSFLNTHIINQIFGIIEILTSLDCNYKLQREHYSTLFLWIKENEKVDKAIVWCVIGNLTRKKESFIKFDDEFKYELGFSIFDMVRERVFSDGQKTTHEQKALALVIGNFIDFGVSSNELSLEKDKHLMNLISKFFDQKPLSYNLMSFMAKKLIQNKVYETAKIIKQRRIIERVLNNSIDNLDMLTMCYSYSDLREYVCDVIYNIPDKRLIELIDSLKNPTGNQAIKEKKCQEYKKANNNVMNILLIAMESPSSMNILRKALRIPNLFESLAMAVFSGLKTTNPADEIIFHLKFLNSLLNAYLMINSDVSISIFGKYEPEIKHSKQFTKIPEEIGNEKCQKPNSNIFDKYFDRICFGADFFLLQALEVFSFAEHSKLGNEAKYELRLAAFVFIRNLMSQSGRARKFAEDIKLQEWIVERAEAFVKHPLNIPVASYTEATKKIGVQKCMLIVKNLCVLFKAITEWNLPEIKNPTRLKDLFDEFKRIYLWIENDSILLNCFLQFIQYISATSIIKACIMQEINGVPLLKGLVKKMTAVTSKIPYTETNQVLLQNGLFTIEKCSHMIEVRLMLRNAKIFQVLDLLHPQIQANKKSSWNDVTVMWLEFFEALSRFEDCECSSGQISLLCRIFRIGNPAMKSLALKIIRNLSMKSSYGDIVIVADEFMQTIDTILIEDGSKYEKLLILQTLLSIASRSEKSRSKLKNSSFNRRLREHLSVMELILDHTNDTEIIQLFNLTSMLKDILYA